VAAAGRCRIAAASVAFLSARSALPAPVEVIIRGERIYPESITASPEDRIFIGIIATYQIFMLKPGATTAAVWNVADNETTLCGSQSLRRSFNQR
jgi:hypothetical protein